MRGATDLLQEPSKLIFVVAQQLRGPQKDWLSAMQMASKDRLTSVQKIVRLTQISQAMADAVKDPGGCFTEHERNYDRPEGVAQQAEGGL